jgi:hypothetical protein
MEAALAKFFYPILKPFFSAIDYVLSPVYMPWARVAALGLFALAILFVFLLNEKYVNLDSPKKDIWHDLRFWTILCLLPHIVVYLFL